MAKIVLPHLWDKTWDESYAYRINDRILKGLHKEADPSTEYYSPAVPEVTGSLHEAVKHDSGTARYDLLPTEYLEATAMVLGFGADKYGQRNWEQGMSWGRVFAALMRHMWAWWRGEKADPETGYSHLWHASCCMAFLVAYEARSVGSDDRGK